VSPADLLTRLLIVPDDGVPYVAWEVLPDGLAADLRAWLAAAAPKTGAKGCRGCANAAGGHPTPHGRTAHACRLAFDRPDVRAWMWGSCAYTGEAGFALLPGAPECPGREEVSNG